MPFQHPLQSCNTKKKIFNKCCVSYHPPLGRRFSLKFKYYLCKWWWVVETKRTKERKRRKGFWKVAFFFLSSFFVCFLKVFSTCDFGSNLVVFFVFWGFDYFRILEIFHCDFVWTLGGIQVRGDTSLSSGLKRCIFSLKTCNIYI